MVTVFQLTPTGSTTPEVWLYTDSFEQPLGRSQTQQVDKHAVIAGGDPSSGTDGLEPGDVTIRGRWFGADAETLATRLKDSILGDPAVTTVDLQAYDSTTWSATSHPLNETYALGQDCSTNEVAQSGGTSYRYTLNLIEQ